MKEALLDYINSRNLGSYLLSVENPWDDNGVPLYVKNLKKIYVKETDSSIEPLIATLGGLTISKETLSSIIYLANDAKRLPANYNAVIDQLKAAKNITAIPGIITRTAEVSVEYSSDIMITQIEIRLERLSK
jgi:hypothetical protein